MQRWLTGILTQYVLRGANAMKIASIGGCCDIVAMASLGLLYHRGELSLRSWYKAERIVADRYRLAEDSLFRKWHPDYDKNIVAQRAERLLYIRET